jgi:hypothetical protein
MLIGFTLLHGALIGVVALAVVLAIVAGVALAKHRRERDHFVSDLHEKLEKDEHDWADIGLGHLAKAIRYGLSGAFAKSWGQIHIMRAIWNDPVQRAAAEQKVLERLVKRVFDSNDTDRITRLRKLIAGQDAIEKVRQTEQSAARAAENAVTAASLAQATPPAPQQAQPVGVAAPPPPAAAA